MTAMPDLGNGVAPVLGGAAPPTTLPSGPQPTVATVPLHVPILMYHLIGGMDGPRALPGLVVPAALFRAQLVALRDAGWRAIDLASLAADLLAGKAPPPRSFAITFDDGHRDGFTQALPILRSLGDTATFFVISDRIGRTGYLTAGELRTLAADGMEIGNHTADHRDIARLAPPRARAEIDGAEVTLRAILGRPPLLFAYPAGEASAATEAEVEAAGIELAVGSQEGALETLSDRFLVPRIRVSPSVSPSRLVTDLEAAAMGRFVP